MIAEMVFGDDIVDAFVETILAPKPDYSRVPFNGRMPRDKTEVSR